MEVRPFQNGHDGIRVAGSDTVGMAVRHHGCDNIFYGSPAGGTYSFNAADRMNLLLLRCLKVTGMPGPGDSIAPGFAHRSLTAGKKATRYSYREEGYFSGVATAGGLIVGIGNRDGNANVRLRQDDTLARIAGSLDGGRRVTVRNFRADYGSFSEDIVGYMLNHCERFIHRFARVSAKWIRSGRQEAINICSKERIYLRL